MVPQDILRDVCARLEAPDRMALDFVLPENAKMATDEDRRLAMLAYADRNGKLQDPAKDVLDFLQRNLGHPTADRLLEKYANVTLKVCRLEHAMATGVYGPRSDYPTPTECEVFDVWYGLCVTLGSLTPDKFDAFMAHKAIATMVLVGPHSNRYTAMLKSCDPVLLEHILFEKIFPDGHVHARTNSRYLTPQTVRTFMELELGPERWARYLEVALSAGAMDIADMVMAEGYRLDGTRVPTQKQEASPGPQLHVRTYPKRPRHDQCERCFTSMYFAAVIAALVYIARVLFYL
jgi:hypothetical protein